MSLWLALARNISFFLAISVASAASLSPHTAASVKVPRRSRTAEQTVQVDAVASLRFLERNITRNSSDAKSAHHALAEQTQDAAANESRSAAMAGLRLPFGFDSEDPKAWLLLWTVGSFVVASICLLCRMWSAYAAAKSGVRAAKALGQGDFSTAGSHLMTSAGHAVEARFGLVTGRVINTTATYAGKGLHAAGTSAYAGVAAAGAAGAASVGAAYASVVGPEEPVKKKKKKGKKKDKANDEEAGQSKEEATLDGWTEVTDPQSGRIYYYNTESGETSWTKPSPKAAAAKAAPAPAQQAQQTGTEAEAPKAGKK